MFGLSKVLRMGEGRKIKRLQKIAEEVLALEPEMADLTDEELKAKTDEFKERIADGETVDDLLYEAFAVAREASYRVLGQKHYLVQVMGGAALHFGGVAEMRTGEGKTLTCVLPAYLNALEGKGVHVVTVNDYLAKRDAEWMGRVHRFLGLKVGVILSNMTPEERKPPTMPTSPTAPITNSVLITFVTTWCTPCPSLFSVATTTPSSTRWTPSSSTKPVPHSSFPAQPTAPRSSTPPLRH